METGTLQEIKVIIKSLVISSPTQISIVKLNKDFRASEGYPIPYGKLGYRNLEEFLQSLSDTIKVHGHGNMATLECVANGRSNHIKEMVKSQKKFRHQKVTQIHSVSGYNSSTYGNLNRNQSMRANDSLNERHQRRNSNERNNNKQKAPVEVLEEDLLPKLHISKETINGCRNHLRELQRVDSNRNEWHNNLENLKLKVLNDDLDEAVPQFAANNLDFPFNFPTKAVDFGNKISSYELPSNLKKGSIVGLFICEIHNPGMFWFHIYKENHELDILMHNIERFYSSLESNEFIIPSSRHVPGQICAALYNRLWHRAEIITHSVNNKTTVFLLDYGTVSDVPSDHIRFLASMFTLPAAQAIRGALSHIKPRSLHWSDEATQYFLSIVLQVMLYGQVTEIDEKRRVHMVMCNSNGPEITQVNKMLVDNKFAMYDESCLIKK